jgi:4-amino-4-deoxy-L-arabinose transferase-like glycosyltransferase
MADPGKKSWPLLVLIVALSLAARALFAFSVDIFQDEAIYWCQAGEGLSFVPHPPGTALLMRLGLAVFGHGSVPGLRLGSVLAGTGFLLMTYILGREFGGRTAGLWAAAMAAVCPLFVALTALATPDAPLLMLWLTFVWVAWRAFRTGRARWWAATAVVLAAGLYTKYMMVLALPSLVLALWATSEGRLVLRRARTWVALLGGLAAFAVPFLAWDGYRGWPALRYHLVARHHWAFQFGLLFDYVLRHLGAISPILMVSALWACARWARLCRKGDARGAWLASFCGVPVLFFLMPSIATERTMIRVHWDAIGYAVGMVGFACLLSETGIHLRQLRRRRSIAILGVGLAAIISTGGLSAALAPQLAVRAGLKPPTSRMLGWADLARCVRDIEARSTTPPSFIAADSFRTALPLAFYLDTRRDIYSLQHERNVRYGLRGELGEWGMDEAHLIAEQAGRDGIYVHRFRPSDRPDVERLPDRVYRLCTSLDKEGDVRIVIRGRTIVHFGVYRLHGLTAPQDPSGGAQGTEQPAGQGMEDE